LLLPFNTASGRTFQRNRPADLPKTEAMSDLVHARDPQASLRPNRISIWPIDDVRFGIDFTYHGATGYADAEFSRTIIEAGGLATSFRQELDGAWSVRIGPLPRDAMLQALDRFAF
jgi:hypothetical protein